MSPVCFLVKEKRNLVDSNIFIHNRSNSYPFIHEITSVFDINTAKNVDVTQLSFKSLYNEYMFYSSNKNYFSVIFDDFFKKYSLSFDDTFLGYIALNNILYNNFFINLRNNGGFFDKCSYSSSLNFLFLYNLAKSYKYISGVVYFNPSFFSELGNVYANLSSFSNVKHLCLNNTSSIVSSFSNQKNNYLSIYNVYTNYFVKSSTSLVNIFKEWSVAVTSSLNERMLST